MPFFRVSTTWCPQIHINHDIEWNKRDFYFHFMDITFQHCILHSNLETFYSYFLFGTNLPHRHFSTLVTAYIELYWNPIPKHLLYLLKTRSTSNSNGKSAKIQWIIFIISIFSALRFNMAINSYILKRITTRCMNTFL